MSTPQHPQQPDVPDVAATPATSQPAQQPGYGPTGHPPPGPAYPAQQPAAGYRTQPEYAPAYRPAAASPHPAATGSRNTLGLVAAILGAVPLLVGFAFPVATFIAARTDTFEFYDIITAVLNGLTVVFGAAALVIGAIALSRPGLPKGLAGVGLGLGIASLVGGLTAFAYPLVMNFVYF